MKSKYLFIAAVPLALLLFNSVSARTAQKPDAVRISPSGQSAAGTPGQKGATYYALERRSIRVTTEFLDGNIAVAERSIDDDIAANLKTPLGVDLNRVKVNRRGGGAEDTVQYSRPGAELIEAQAESGAANPPTLDWLNRQSHHFYQDNVTSAASLRWQNGSIRKNGASTEDDAASEAQTVQSVETVWSNGLVAKTRRQRLKAGDQFYGQPVSGDVLVTTISKDGIRVGTANYLVTDRIYTWKMPGVSEGLITNAHLTPRYGGWLFKPDMIWMNLQALGSYEWGRARAASSSTAVSKTASACAAPKPSLAQRLASLLSTPVYAAPAPNEEGCDDLHWLDGTMYRFCCDIHDLCYEKYGCTSRSWWRLSWNCTRCNGEVVWCFAGGGTGKGPMWM
jgi:hypothetical protein